MKIYFLPFVISWAVLASIVIALAVYRKMIAGAEDDSLHVAAREANLVTQQASVAQKLESIDKWGKLLTIFVVAYGLTIAGAYFYNVWVETSTSIVAG